MLGKCERKGWVPGLDHKPFQFGFFLEEERYKICTRHHTEKSIGLKGSLKLTEEYKPLYSELLNLWAVAPLRFK